MLLLLLLLATLWKLGHPRKWFVRSAYAVHGRTHAGLASFYRPFIFIFLALRVGSLFLPLWIATILGLLQYTANVIHEAYLTLLAHESALFVIPGEPNVALALSRVVLSP